jgi:trimeric autotransporter adhesin
VFDKQGNFYISDGYSCRIRKINASGIINTVVGTGVCGFNGDNIPATIAQIGVAAQVIIDSLGNLFITDGGNHRVRKIDQSTGIITTIAGTGLSSFGGDGGPASAASLNSPNAICFDKIGNMYISDATNYRIRRINTSGIISTIAGIGIPGFSGDNGAATAAKLWLTRSIIFDDNGNLFISDWGANRIRKIDTAGIITTFAGNGGVGFFGDGGPATNSTFTGIGQICFDSFYNMFVPDYSNDRVHMIDKDGYIHSVAGNGIDGVFSGDGGPATAAGIYRPSAVTIDTCGNLYISDIGNERVRKVTYPHCGYLELAVQKKETALSIYPNPATTEITISAPNKIKEVSVWNVVGVKVTDHTCHAQKTEIRISDLPAGVYFVRVMDEEGAVVVRRVVKE